MVDVSPFPREKVVGVDRVGWKCIEDPPVSFRHYSDSLYCRPSGERGGEELASTVEERVCSGGGSSARFTSKTGSDSSQTPSKIPR
jgi:hypothetical protein